jgi:hypothetical protein
VNKPQPKPAARVIAPVSEDTTKLLSGFSLNATWTGGAQRLAMINGRLYATGDVLEARINAKDAKGGSPDKGRGSDAASLSSGGKQAPTENSLTEPFVVSQILADKVLLTRRGVTLELTFTDKTDGRPSSVPSKSALRKTGVRTGR